jgi:hypothetical protein
MVSLLASPSESVYTLVQDRSNPKALWQQGSNHKGALHVGALHVGLPLQG